MDDFNSYDPNAGLNGGTGGTGWDANGWSAIANTTVQAASLSYSNGNVLVSGGSRAVQITNAGAGSSIVMSRTLDAAETADTIYFSFLFRGVAMTANDETSFMVTNNGSSNFNSGQIGTDAVSSHDWYLRLLGSNTSQRDGGKPGGGAATGTTYFLVGKLYKSTPGAGNNYDRGNIFVDPNDTNAESGTSLATPASENIRVSSIDAFLARVTEVRSGDVYMIDELRIGTEWSDVVVPEPATLGLMVLGLAGMMIRRRRTI